MILAEEGKKIIATSELWPADASSSKCNFFIHASDAMIQPQTATSIPSPWHDTAGSGHVDVLSGEGGIGPVSYR